MKKLYCLTIAGCLAILTGCNGCRNDWKHFQSATVSIKRDVTLYSHDGSIIREWKGITSKVEDQGGTLYFIDNNEKSVTIGGGTMIVEEQ